MGQEIISLIGPLIREVEKLGQIFFEINEWASMKKPAQ